MADTSLITPLQLARGSALEKGPLADSGDVRHFSKEDAFSATAFSNPTRQLANRDNKIADKVNEVIASVNNREKPIYVPVICTSLPAGVSETVVSVRIPRGYESRVLDAAITSTPAHGVRLEILHSAHTYGASSGTQVILTADEFDGGSDFWPTGEFIVRIYNEGPVSASLTGGLILTIRPVGPSAGGLLGPGAIGPQGAPGGRGFQGYQGYQGATGAQGQSVVSNNVTFTPQNSLVFPQSGRTYLVTLSWNASQGQFPELGPVLQKPIYPVGATEALWVKEDSRTGPTSITWEVYVPRQSQYGSTSFNGPVHAQGIWSNSTGTDPICSWQPPTEVT